MSLGDVTNEKGLEAVGIAKQDVVASDACAALRGLIPLTVERADIESLRDRSDDELLISWRGACKEENHYADLYLEALRPALELQAEMNRRGLL
jgi:hypothetical protein